ncbi:pilus assembly protein [Variovorax sp. PBL-E5]|uniref:pilus assembly protein n=1 Tax=Variovorax sp. PBL-E5 TaxID=434014 RepID=UPI001316F4AC|nr:PilC/PilY family type IV pilus protein [Variovorax sp. PBL-E5]VTU26718.1 Tfp pilus assembly protein, tip-associated adhesin PilY1 [Variovorax sp. PBL-E5]
MKKKRIAWTVAAVLVTVRAEAAISQLPLVTTNVTVPPNLMFTLDDSGSMDFECFPDSMCTTPDGVVYAGVVPWGFGIFKNAVITYDGSSLLARQARSTRNPLYYNPAVTYRPWLKSDGTRFPTYPANAAPVDPRAPATTVDLTGLPKLMTARWCSDLANCVDSERSAPIAQYYTLKAGASGDLLSDYRQNLITNLPGWPQTFPKNPNRVDCVSPTLCTYAEEIQNFTNWFVYARSRLRVAIGGTSEAFALVPPSYRVGYGTINEVPTLVDGVNNNAVRMGVRPFIGTPKDNFYAQLQSAGTQPNGTPLRRAMDDVGQYFSRTDAQSPWASDPSVGESPANHLSCRRAYHVLMTDGLWNSTAAQTAGANADADNTVGPLITSADGKTSYQYHPAPPYAGPGESSLADVAMYYWNHDLRPDLPNDMPVTGSDPAFWQHMVNYTIAFGVNGKLRNPEDLPALQAGTASWGTVGDDSSKVDDLWHAAINSRGIARSASSITDYTAALTSIIQDIQTRDSSEAGVALSSRSYSSSTLEYVPSYRATDWNGDVQAVKLTDGSNVWLASQQLPAASARNIFTFTNTATKGVPFTLSALDAAGMTSQLDASNASALIPYLRGDRTGEGTTFRKRTGAIGDIVNSSPALVKDLFDGQYDFLATSTPGQSSYQRFINAKKFREAQLFVGANDGMLHAFDATDGIESFAFMPRAVLGTVKQLADPAYAHRFFVDGPLTETDVYDGSASKWRNLVLGAGGAGAKNLFAINVPVAAFPAKGDPVPLTRAQSTPGGSDILWEIDATNPSFSELGYVLQAPAAGILKDGRWVVVIGNGYESATGRAQLYLIDAITGSRLAVLDTGVGSLAAPNGLGGVTLVRDGTQRVVAAYAGDLAGNLWKFDLSSPTPSEWRVAFGGLPFFKAANRQGQPEPITAAPAFTRHPLGGTMLFVGTGKLQDAGDQDVLAERSIYGVWDTVAIGTPSSNSGDRITDNASLVTQTLSNLAVGGATGRYFAISNNPVDYGSGANAQKRGWQVHLTIAAGLRSISAPQVDGGRVIIDTMVPAATGNGCAPASLGSYTFVVDPFSGAPGLPGPTFDTSGDGKLDGADDATAAVTLFSTTGKRTILHYSGSLIGLEGAGTVRSEGNGSSNAGSGRSGSSSAGPGGNGSNTAGRTTEEQKTQLLKSPTGRQWRQIITPPSY